MINEDGIVNTVYEIVNEHIFYIPMRHIYNPIRGIMYIDKLEIGLGNNTDVSDIITIRNHNNSFTVFDKEFHDTYITLSMSPKLNEEFYKYPFPVLTEK
jgi:hypothetical protein